MGGWMGGQYVILLVVFSALTSSQAVLLSLAQPAVYSRWVFNAAMEAVKLLMSGMQLMRARHAQSGSAASPSAALELDSGLHLLRFGVPAVLYAAKNYIQMVVLEYLDAPTYQVIRSANVLGVAVCAALLLGRRFSRIQIHALLLLSMGTVLVSMHNTSSSQARSPQPSTVDPGMSDDLMSPWSGIRPDRLYGLLLGLVVAFLSAFAGIYSEHVLKRQRKHRGGESEYETSIHVQGVQLYGFQTMLNLVGLVYYEYDRIWSWPTLLQGFTPLVLAAVLNGALSGMACARVLKYLDNVAKVYASTVSIIITSVVAWLWMGFGLSMLFCMGASLIAVSLDLYHNVRTLKTQQPQKGK